MTKQNQTTIASLANFREAIAAVEAATRHIRSPRLQDFVAHVLGRAQRRTEATRLLRAFVAGVGGSDALTYAEYRVVEALDAATYIGTQPARQKFVREALQRVASFAALVEREGEDHLNKVLAHGWALFGPEALERVLAFWAGLANQQGGEVPFPWHLSVARDYIRAWAEQVLRASKEGEAGMQPPLAGIALEDEEGWDLSLGWEGTWTPERRFVAKFLFGEDGQVVSVRAEWDSATGRPSRFLGLESLLALQACTDFGPFEDIESA